jgi:hypothetical protein
MDDLKSYTQSMWFPWINNYYMIQLMLLIIYKIT